MLSEIAHFLRHVPGNLRMMRTMDQAELYDTLMLRAEEHGLTERRAWLTADLQGEVLEVGCGTGLMFRHYGSGVRVTAIEPDKRFRALAYQRANEATASITVDPHGVESLPYDDDRFSAAVIAMVLCSVDSVEEALREICRVLEPGARIRMIEHVRSERAVAGALMDVVNPLWLVLNKQGCRLNRRVEPALRDAGLDVSHIEPMPLRSPGLPAFPFVMIEATVRG